MPRAQAFHLNPRRIVHETIDDETIIIDLDTGSYYSLRGSGPAIWELIVDGCSDIEAVDAMQKRYDADPRVLGDATRGLIARLREAGLIERAEQDHHATAGMNAAAREAAENFEAPSLEKFTDMEYFLLLDPIHEVEEGGWPHADAASARPSPAG
jgi:hypothetical protein